MTAALLARCLRRRGAAAMSHYCAAVESITDGFNLRLCQFAELCAPSLGRLRRHSKACAKISRRLESRC